MEWQAECHCGQRRATCVGAPDRVSDCHCTDCERRTGSVFAGTASFPADKVTTAGERYRFTRASDSGRTNVYHFCPICGATVFYDVAMRPGMISVPAGAFAAADFPPPTVQLFDPRRVAWCTIDAGELPPPETIGSGDGRCDGRRIRSRWARSSTVSRLAGDHPVL